MARQGKPRRGDIRGNTSGCRPPTRTCFITSFSAPKNAYHFSAKNSEELYRYVGGIVRAEGGVQLEIGGMADHVHILCKFKPSIAVSEMLAKIKANSSKWANDHKMKMRKFGWQEGYAAFSVSESQAPAVREYIRNQREHHHKQNYQEEFIALLERHGIEYNPRYVLD